MKLYRPTGLRLASQHCPAALSFMEARTPYDRRQFEAGTAAHAVLQAIGEATKARGELSEQDMEVVADATCQRLIEHGRIEEGEQEPPLSADMVFEGRELALTWAVNHPLQADAHYEIGLAVDADWKPVEFDSPKARLRCILDVLWIDEPADEESTHRALVVRDYKSAWPTDAKELTTIQRKSQALVAVAHFGIEFDELRLEVVNLRTMKLFSEPLFFEHGAEDVLKQWRTDLAGTMDALDRQEHRGRRPASPGFGCHGCPFLMRCDDAMRYFDDTRIPGTAEQRAEMYAVAWATQQRLADMLRADAAEAPIAIDKGIVGIQAKPKRVLVEDAFSRLCDEWGLEQEATKARGLVKAAKLTPTNAEAIAKVLFPSRSDAKNRSEFVESLCTQVIERGFGIYPKPDADKETRRDAATSAA